MTADPPFSSVTPEPLYWNRRAFLRAAALAAAGASLPRSSSSADTLSVARRLVTTDDPPTPFESATTYNNFYELGPEKTDPARHASALTTSPWSVTVDGECGKPSLYSLDDLIKPHALEERVYRMRCVEGWSMVIPWVGVPLGDVLTRAQPTPRARFVEFTSLVRPSEMPSQRPGLVSILPWPYREALRLDEAMHPLALLAVGLYGRTLPAQNGAPLRLVVPWKYGFKGIKSIVRIRFTETQPSTTWRIAEPLLYGFYANVNPAPTASIFRDQSTERRLGEFLMRKTLPFNGYADQVAGLYAGLDLRQNF